MCPLPCDGLGPSPDARRYHDSWPRTIVGLLDGTTGESISPIDDALKRRVTNERRSVAFLDGGRWGPAPWAVPPATPCQPGNQYTCFLTMPSPLPNQMPRCWGIIAANRPALWEREERERVCVCVERRKAIPGCLPFHLMGSRPANALSPPAIDTLALLIPSPFSSHPRQPIVGVPGCRYVRMYLRTYIYTPTLVPLSLAAATRRCRPTAQCRVSRGPCTPSRHPSAIALRPTVPDVKPVSVCWSPAPLLPVPPQFMRSTSEAM